MYWKFTLAFVKVVATTKKNANVTLVFQILHRIVHVSIKIPQVQSISILKRETEITIRSSTAKMYTLVCKEGIPVILCIV